MEIREMILNILKNKNYSPMKYEDIYAKLDLHPKQSGAFLSELDLMEKEGILIKTKKEKYVLPQKINMVVGILKNNKKGFGFVIPESDSEGDVYISPNDMNGAMHNDKVLVDVLCHETQDKKREGHIRKVLIRANDEIVGLFKSSGKYGFVIPDDIKIVDDIFIPKESINNAKTDDKVVVKITKWPLDERNPEGKIIEILGSSNDVGTDILSIIRQYKLSETFPDKVLKQTNAIEDNLSEDEIQQRKDLRQKNSFTIDGADAKDLDDAISIEKLENGNYFLGVHIADVSHYVKENSFLDKESLKRGCSVYLLNKVIPMLPPKLSNHLCSLAPGEDRLTLSIEMEIDKEGQVISHSISNSIINSKERMVYTDVSDIIENKDQQLIQQYEHIYKEICWMNELASLLNEQRKNRGSIDFDFDESYIHLDENGIPINVEIAERRVANRIIEEFMLIANETIAEHFFWLDIPFVFRVHEKPNPDKILEFKKFILNFGYIMRGNNDKVHPKALQEITKKIKGKREENIINTIMLRSLRKAIYAPKCLGHFGLATDYYCHFTAPIRRYPDLIVHRIIKEYMISPFSEERKKDLENKVKVAAERSTEAEIEAEEAERDVEDLKKAEYMMNNIGNIYDGLISGVASFGIFVELENTIEGLVRISSIDDDYYIYEPEKYRFVGERSKKIYAIGEPVKIKVVNADILSREIDFELVENE